MSTIACFNHVSVLIFVIHDFFPYLIVSWTMNVLNCHLLQRKYSNVFFFLSCGLWGTARPKIVNNGNIFFLLFLSSYRSYVFDGHSRLRVCICKISRDRRVKLVFLNKVIGKSDFTWRKKTDFF